MEDCLLLKVKESEIDELGQFAAGVWTEHYQSILSSDQISYMVDRFQSPAAIRAQLAHDGYEYYWVLDSGIKAGYCAIQPQENALFLSKLYLAKEFRGRGLARRTLACLRERCRAESVLKIWLTVNRYNSSVSVYESLGFIKTREQVADIGNGYVMDDYIMEYLIKA